MMKQPLTPTLLAALAVGMIAAPAAARPSPEDKLSHALAGREAGAPVDCLNLRNIRSNEIIDGTAIIYRTGANKLYVNYPDGASWLDDDDILVTRTTGSQLCSIDVVQLVNRSSRFPRGSVNLGKFVPYVRATAERQK